MVVAYRLRKTVQELCRDCTAMEIADWLTFFEMQSEAERGKGRGGGVAPAKMRGIMQSIGAEVARKEALKRGR